MEGGVTIIVPAYNEEANISAALDSVNQALEGIAGDHEIIVIDDGSHDKTSEIARARAARDPRIRVVVHAVNQGYGVAYREGLRLAHKEYYAIFPGDNDMSGESLRDILKMRGKADLVISYPQGGHTRAFLRRVMSRTYVITLNLLFGFHLRYFNGPFVYRTCLARDMKIVSTGLSVTAEGVIRLLKRGYSYIEVPFKHTGRRAEQSKALSLKNMVPVFRVVLILVWDIYFSRKKLGEKIA